MKKIDVEVKGLCNGGYIPAALNLDGKRIVVTGVLSISSKKDENGQKQTDFLVNTADGEFNLVQIGNDFYLD